MPAVIYPAERRVLEFLGQYIQRHGYAPTLREICKGVGLSSVATAHEHVQRLHERGFIKKWPGAGRGIEIVRQNVVLGPSQEGPVDLPILGFIAAGSPLEPHTDPNAYLTIAPGLIPQGKSAYVLQVKGSSMIDDGILEGDYVVIQYQEEAHDGDIVVATLPSGFATLKKIYFEDKRIKLQPANSSMSPIYATEVKIQGKVVALVRKYN